MLHTASAGAAADFSSSSSNYYKCCCTHLKVGGGDLTSFIPRVTTAPSSVRERLTDNLYMAGGKHRLVLAAACPICMLNPNDANDFDWTGQF